MIGISQFAAIFQSVTCIALLVVVLLKISAHLRLDAFRQRMFALRDEMFDYAADGKIGFDNPAYMLLRELMNGCIRYAHNLTLFRVVTNSIGNRLIGVASTQKWSEKWGHALAVVEDENVRRDLCDFHDRAMALVALRLVFGSPFLFIAVFVLLLWLLLRSGWRMGRQSLEQWVGQAATETVSKVIDPREVEEAAAAAA